MNAEPVSGMPDEFFIGAVFEQVAESGTGGLDGAVPQQVLPQLPTTSCHTSFRGGRSFSVFARR